MLRRVGLIEGNLPVIFLPEAVYLVHGSVLSLAFVEPNNRDNLSNADGQRTPAHCTMRAWVLARRPSAS
jgi:hypothetical protein